jgi:predicted glycosyltransferase
VSRPRLLFYVQHLLGIGHLVRGSRLAKAMAEGPFEVTVVIGGPLPPNLDFGAARIICLPPVKAGSGGFADLVTPEGDIFGPEARAARRDLLLGHTEALRPDILLIEAFPFGRRPMRFELLPLLESVKAWSRPPLIAASLRDILQESRKPSRNAETVDLVRRSFDLVIVHGDPGLSRLEDSFPLAGEIADKIVYSGLVGPSRNAPPSTEHFDVIVSVGGGAVGASLIDKALAARPLSRMAEASWLVLTGPNGLGSNGMAAVPGVTLRAFEPDLPARLRQAKLSISQAGYNTVADLLSGPDCRAVLVPYAAAGETEQRRRAALLQQRQWAVVVEEASLDPQRLAAAVDRALDLPARRSTFDFDGAIETGRILEERLRRRRNSTAPGIPLS